MLPKREVVPDIVTAGLPSVAVRAPSHPIARALLAAAKLPIAAPSANKFTQLSPTRASHVAASFGEKLMILDGGSCNCGIESTVLDLTGNVPILLRPGGIARAQIEEIVGPIRLRDEIEYSIADETPRSSPGLIERHYAPRATLMVFENEAQLSQLVTQFHMAKAGALLLNITNTAFENAVPMPRNATEYARALYRVLHELDELNCDAILVEAVPDDALWDGVRDRLKRAATPAK